MTDWREKAKDGFMFHEVFAAYLQTDWGPRCEKFSWGCLTCQLWAVHDEIKWAEEDNAQD